MGDASGANLIASAYVFGGASIIFASMPFIFTIIKGVINANRNQHSASIFKTIGIAYFVHIFSCIFFMLMIKLLDKLNNLQASFTIEKDIFAIFWSRSKNEIFSLAKASGSVEDESAYLTLFSIQLGFDLAILIVPFLLIILAFSYALLQAKKDSYQYNYTGVLSWIIISVISVIFLYILWAKIASIAMFMQNGDTLLTLMQKAYVEIIEMAL